MIKANELKKKKDEMQLKLIGKAVDPIWKMKDKENLGYITKEQCCEIAEAALKIIGQDKYYNEANFLKAFEILILAGDVMSGHVSADELKSAVIEKTNEI